MNGSSEDFDPAAITIATERARILAERDVGTACRCCTQRVKVYTRTLNAERAEELIRLLGLMAKRPAPYWVHASEFVVQKGGDYAKMEVEPWGLIEAQPAQVGVVTNGFWRLTDQGISFAKGRATALRQVRLCLDEPLDPQPEARVWIFDILRDATYRDARRYEEHMKVRLAGLSALSW